VNENICQHSSANKSAENVNEFSRLYRDIYSDPSIIGQSDYEVVVGYVSEVKCQQVHEYEEEFGPAPFPRPASYNSWLERNRRSEPPKSPQTAPAPSKPSAAVSTEKDQ
jgi:hypothetical protein